MVKDRREKTRDTKQISKRVGGEIVTKEKERNKELTLIEKISNKRDRER